MTTFRALLLYPESIASAIVWIAVTVRFITTVRRGIGRSGPAQRQAWLFWAIFFALAVASVVHHPLFRTFLALNVGEWFRQVPERLMSIAVYLLGVQICYEFARPMRPRWNWPVCMSLLVFGAYVLLATGIASGKMIESGVMSWDIFISLLLDYAVFLMVVRVGIPSFVWAWRHERQRPMRLRFAVMVAVHAGIGVWKATAVLETVIVALGHAYNFAPLYSFLAIFCTMTFVASHLMPAGFFMRLTMLQDYLSDLITFTFIRALECQTARLTGRQAAALGGGGTVLHSPAVAVYRSVIAVLDTRKLLKTQTHPLAQKLSEKLDAVTYPDLDYSEVISGLRQVGKELGFRSLIQLSI